MLCMLKKYKHKHLYNANLSQHNNKLQTLTQKYYKHYIHYEHLKTLQTLKNITITEIDKQSFKKMKSLLCTKSF